MHGANHEPGTAPAVMRLLTIRELEQVKLMVMPSIGDRQKLATPKEKVGCQQRVTMPQMSMASSSILVDRKAEKLRSQRVSIEIQFSLGTIA